MKIQATMTIWMNYNIDPEKYPQITIEDMSPHEEEQILRKEKQRFIDDPDEFWEEFNTTDEQHVSIKTAFVS